MRKREEIPLFGNLTAMIDVVFQIIIFFVCTSNLQRNALDERIALAKAPHGKPVGIKDPLEIVVEVSKQGMIKIARTPLTQGELRGILTKAFNENGGRVPVVIRGDARASHLMIRSAMDTCANCGIWQIKIAALKEKGR